MVLKGLLGHWEGCKLLWGAGVVAGEGVLMVPGDRSTVSTMGPPSHD